LGAGEGRGAKKKGRQEKKLTRMTTLDQGEFSG